MQVSDVPFDQEHLADVRERQILRRGQHLDGAGGDPAVALISGGVGYRHLDTGVDDVMFPGTPMVTLHSGWHYVLVEAGPERPRKMQVLHEKIAGSRWVMFDNSPRLAFHEEPGRYRAVLELFTVRSGHPRSADRGYRAGPSALLDA